LNFGMLIPYSDVCAGFPRACSRNHVFT